MIEIIEKLTVAAMYVIETDASEITEKAVPEEFGILNITSTQLEENTSIEI